MDKKTVYLIIGKSGSGKTTIVNTICNKNNNYICLDSYTTRPPRYDGEVGHIFVDYNTYKTHKKNGEICADTNFHNNMYWSTHSQLSISTFYIIDMKGVNDLKNSCWNDYNFIAIYIKCPIIRRLHRMLKRDGIIKTISRYINDLKMFRGLQYDYKIINKDLAQSINKLENIIINNKGDKTYDKS